MVVVEASFFLCHCILCNFAFLCKNDIMDGILSICYDHDQYPNNYLILIVTTFYNATLRWFVFVMIQ